MWKLTDLAQSHIESLEDEGIKLTPQEVLYIQQLSLDVAYPDWDALRSIGVTRSVGGTTLSSMTLAGAYWFDEAQKHFITDIDKSFCLAYALANGHNKELLTDGDIVSKVEKWKRTLTCTPEELFLATKDIVGDKIHIANESDEEEAENIALGSLVQTAISLCGGTPDLWEWECCIRFVEQLITKTIHNKISFNGGKVDNSHKSLLQLAMYCKQIRDERKGVSNG